MHDQSGSSPAALRENLASTPATRATVVAIGTGRATVSVETAAACVRCATGRGCGAGLLLRRRCTRIEVRVASGLTLRPGDRVRLEIAPDRLLAAAGLAYGLPLAGFVAGALVAAAAAPGHDLAAVLAAAAGLGAGVLLGRLGCHRPDRPAGCVPIVAEKLG